LAISATEWRSAFPAIPGLLLGTIESLAFFGNGAKPLLPFAKQLFPARLWTRFQPSTNA
jgi:hypothetical protein